MTPSERQPSHPLHDLFFLAMFLLRPLPPNVFPRVKSANRGPRTTRSNRSVWNNITTRKTLHCSKTFQGLVANVANMPSGLADDQLRLMLEGRRNLTASLCLQLLSWLPTAHLAYRDYSTAIETAQGERPIALRVRDHGALAELPQDLFSPRHAYAMPRLRPVARMNDYAFR